MSKVRLYTKLDDVECDAILSEKARCVASLEDLVMISCITSHASDNSLKDFKSETIEPSFSVRSW